MAQRATATAVAAPSKYWAPLVVVGLVAVVAGSVLPRLLPDEVPLTPPPAKQVAASSGDLHYVPPQPPEVPSTRDLFFRLAAMTVVVLVVGVGVVAASRHWLRGLTPSPAGDSKLRLLETLQLGNRCSLHLVQLTSRQVLVGADATGIKSVVPLPDDFENVLRDEDTRPA